MIRDPPQNMLQHTHLVLISELTSEGPPGVYAEYVSQVSLCGSKTDAVFFPISEVNKDRVSLDNGLSAEGTIASASLSDMQYDEKVCPNVYVSSSMQV